MRPSAHGSSWCDRHASDQSPASVPPFSSCRTAVGFHGGRVDQDLRRRSTCGSQRLEDVLPDALIGPTDEAIVERLSRAIRQGRIHPTASRLQNMDDATDHPPVIHARFASGIRREMRLKPGELLLGQPKKMLVHSKAPSGTLESKIDRRGNIFYGSGPLNRTIASCFEAWLCCLPLAVSDALQLRCAEHDRSAPLGLCRLRVHRDVVRKPVACTPV